MYLQDDQIKGPPSVVGGQDTSVLGAASSSFVQGFENTSLGAGAKLLAGMQYHDDQVLDEKGYATSPYARDGGFQPGMTVAQAKVAAAKYDQEHAAYAQQGHAIASIAGGITGGLMDPLYYIPYIDALAPAMRTAMIARRGEVLTEASTQFLNASAASLIEQPLIYAKDQAYGEKYDLSDAAESVAVASLGGGFFGGLSAKMRLRLPQVVAGTQKAMDDIHMGRQVDTASVVNPVASTDTKIQASLRAGEIPEVLPTDSPEALRAVQAAKTGEDQDFLQSFKDDGGKSYYESKIKELGDRTDVETRLRVDQMTPEQKTKALLTDDLTGIPNRRAFQESERMPVQVATDLDNFKAVNDEMTHEGGDKVLKNVASVLDDEFKKAGGRVYRMGGDEFHGEAPTPEAAHAAMKGARSRLDRAIIEVTLPDGTKLTKKGMGISYGAGKNRIEAEVGLKADKSAREQAGLRTERKADVERVAADAAQRLKDNLGDRASQLAYYKERLAAVTHREPDWSPTGPTPEPTKTADLSGLPLTDAEKAHLQAVDEESAKLEAMARALKAGASCYGL